MKSALSTNFELSAINLHEQCIPATRNPQPATKYQKTENRSQKTDIPASNRPIQRAMPYALCPMPFFAPRTA
jgi:hypothetical protein